MARAQFRNLDNNYAGGGNATSIIFIGNHHMIRYEFKEGPVSFHKAAVDAHACGEEAMRIYKSPDWSNPDPGITAAEDPANPLHGLFEWDNEKCGLSHRRHQWRSFVASIRVVEVKRGIESEPARLFLSAKLAGERRSYYSTPDIKKRVDLQIAVMSEARKYLETFRARFSELREIFPDIEKAIAKLDARIADAGGIGSAAE